RDLQVRGQNGNRGSLSIGDWLGCQAYWVNSVSFLIYNPFVLETWSQTQQLRSPIPSDLLLNAFLLF
ncbi:MAG: hypothetical protein ACOVQ7_23040, partial [Limnoraphis robusta]